MFTPTLDLIQGKISACSFLIYGLKIMNKNPSSSSRNLTIFRAHYGTSPEVVSYLWGRISSNKILTQKGAIYKHLLWSLLFMKVYATEHVLSGMVNCNEKTFRKWIWIVIPIISQVSYEEVSLIHILISFKTRIAYFY